MSDVSHRLGRRHAVDPRDNLFLAASQLDLERPRQATTGYKYYYNRFNADQTGPTCVANTGAHILGDSPHTWPLSWLDTLPNRTLRDNAGSLVSPVGYKSQYSGQTGFRGLLYDQAQLVDEWSDTPPGGGTSFRAAAKVLQRWGLIESYLWLRSVDEVALAVRNHGPVALGCDWLEDMYYDVSDGQLIHATGASVGGHEVVLDGVNLGTRRFRIQTWGIHFRISFSDVGILLATGDACVVTEPTT